MLFLHVILFVLYSLGKPIDSYWFKMSCMSCLVFICVHCFFLEMMKLYKDMNATSFCMNKPYFCWNCFLIDWRHKRLKNTIDLLLFYGERFYGFSESVMLQNEHGIESASVIDASISVSWTSTPYAFTPFFFFTFHI